MKNIIQYTMSSFLDKKSFFFRWKLGDDNRHSTPERKKKRKRYEEMRCHVIEKVRKWKGEATEWIWDTYEDADKFINKII